MTPGLELGVSKAVDATVAAIVAHLIDRARRDERGVYWEHSPSRNPYLRDDPARISLGTGDAGVLYFLGQYARRHPSSAICEVIALGVASVNARLRTVEFKHGYYSGTAGTLAALLSLDGISGVHEDSDLIRNFVAWSETDQPSFMTRVGVSEGLAGTLLGLELLETGRPVFGTARARRALLRRIYAATHLSEHGIYWDRYPFSIRPCVGFAGGNAGVEYVLSGYSMQARMDSANWLLSGALAHDAAEFREDIANWPDYTNFAHFSRPDIRHKLKASLEAGEPVAFAQPGDNATWADGAAGILIARCELARNGLVDAIELDRDLKRAAARVARAAEVIGPNASFALYSGIGGLTLGLSHAAHFMQDPSLTRIALQLIEECAMRESRTGSNGTANNLFEGIAGQGHLLLQGPSTLAGENSILMPRVQPTPGLEAPIERPESMQLMVDRRMAATKRLMPSFTVPALPAKLSLPTFKEAVLSGRNAQLDRAIEHDLERQSVESRQICYNFIFQRDMRRKKLNEQTLSFGDEQLGRSIVTIAEGTRLVPAPDQLNGKPKYLLQQEHYLGIREMELSGETADVLLALEEPTQVAQLCELLAARAPAGGRPVTPGETMAVVRRSLELGIVETIA